MSKISRILPTKIFYDKDGTIHREDGPAVIYGCGTKDWFIHGKRHRSDGPAVVWHNGKSGLWYINGYNITNLVREWAKEINIDLNNLSEDDKTIIVMKWSDYGK